MKIFERITIIGLGLIGGSLALAIKEKHLAGQVIGVSRKQSTIRRALSLGVVDAVSLDVKKGVRHSDLVILATPILKIIDIGKGMSSALKKGAIVTDTGSTKEAIVRRLESSLQDSVSFVGSHPLAGSEKSGLDYIEKDLFKGAYCILTKTSRTNPKTLSKIKKFWELLGMKVEVMNPEKHDRVVSKLSHLPHAAAVGLSNASGGLNLHLAAGGFKDTTRIASSSPELWRDIFITNRKNIARDIMVLKKELSKIEEGLKKNNSSGLLELFKTAKAVRDSV